MSFKMKTRKSFEETESIPTLSLVDYLDSCLMCCESINQPKSTTTDQSQFLSICYEALQFSQIQQDLIELDLDKTEIQFCVQCKEILNSFKDIQRQIAALNHELTQIQETISDAILVEESTQNGNRNSLNINRSRIAKEIRNKSESEPIRILKVETITGDLSARDNIAEEKICKICSLPFSEFGKLDRLSVEDQEIRKYYETYMRDKKPDVTITEEDQVHRSCKNKMRSYVNSLQAGSTSTGSKVTLPRSNSENMIDEDWFPSSPAPSPTPSESKDVKYTRRLTRKKYRNPKVPARQPSADEVESILARPCHIQLQRVDEINSKTEDGKWDVALFRKNKRSRMNKLLWKKKKRLRELKNVIVKNGRPRGMLPEKCSYDPTRTKKERYVCGYCNKGKPSGYALGIHVRVCHTDGFETLCEFCSKPFKRKSSMLNHQRKMHRDQLLSTRPDTEVQLMRIKEMTCQICKITFTSIGGKKIHDGSVHGNGVNFFCDTCGSGWISLARLNHHMKVHQGKFIQCSECDMKFNRVNTLRRHFNNKHRGIRQFKCLHCEKTFSDTHARKRHMTLIHEDLLQEGAKGFSCNLCSYACACREYLVIHSKTKKHIEKIKELGFSDINTGLNFNGTKPRKPQLV